MPPTPQLPRNLFIATPGAIYLHSQASKKLLFKCETLDGILNSRASKDNSGLLAVADSQVVLLHDSERGNGRVYKLKSGDVSYLYALVQRRKRLKVR